MKNSKFVKVCLMLRALIFTTKGVKPNLTEVVCIEKCTIEIYNPNHLYFHIFTNNWRLLWSCQIHIHGLKNVLFVFLSAHSIKCINLENICFIAFDSAACVLLKCDLLIKSSKLFKNKPGREETFSNLFLRPSKCQNLKCDCQISAVAKCAFGTEWRPSRPVDLS